MDKNNDLYKKQTLPKTDNKAPPCLYPEVVVIPQGSASSTSVSFDLSTQTDNRVPSCLYPEVVVIPHGSVSSTSVSSDLSTQTDNRVPSCLYPEVVVIPHGSVSSTSVSSDLSTQTDNRVPSCLYPEVVVIPQGSVSSISVSSNLFRPPVSGGYWACSECSLVDGAISYQIPVSSTKKVSFKKQMLKRITSLLFSCIKPKQNHASQTPSAVSVRSVCVDTRSGEASVRSVHPAIQRLRMRPQDMYTIFNVDPFY